MTYMPRKILVIEDDLNFVLFIRSGPANSEVPGRASSLCRLTHAGAKKWDTGRLRHQVVKADGSTTIAPVAAKDRGPTLAPGHGRSTAWERIVGCMRARPLRERTT